MKSTRREFIAISVTLAAAPSFSVRAQAATIVTLLGNGMPGTADDGAAAASAQINDPYGITEDPARTGLFLWTTAPIGC